MRNSASQRALCSRSRSRWRSRRLSALVALTLLIFVLHASLHPPQLLSSTVDAQLRQLVHHRYRLPWLVAQHMNSRALHLCVANLSSGSYASRPLASSSSPRARFVIIHVRNGLCNRLRALSSAISFATKTNRLPIIIWQRSIHLNASLHHIIDSTHLPYAVLDHFVSDAQLSHAVGSDQAWANFDMYYYLYSQPEINTTWSRSIYFDSATVMTTKLNDWQSENAWLRTVPWQPHIVRLSNSVLQEGTLGVAGVHIRNRTIEHDIVGFKHATTLYSKDSIQVVDRWRATSNIHSFIPTMRHMLANRTVTKFFVASDTVQVCTQLEQLFGKQHISFLPRDCDDRGAACVKYAMADLLVLSKLNMLLGSSYSSYTLMVSRLGGPSALLSGTHFGYRYEAQR